MHIKDLKPKMGNIDIVADVVSKSEPRTFDKFGKSGRVCDAQIKDATGEVKLTLWNEQVDQVDVGDKVHLTNGYADEFKGNLQVSTGKFGALEIVGKGGAAPSAAPAKADSELEELSEELEDLDDEYGEDE